MELKELIAIQNKFDEEHGWLPKGQTGEALLSEIRKDLVGLFGEIGEFSNLIKKISLETDRIQDDALCDALLEKNHQDLELEVVDSLIYLIRIATHLNMDIEKQYSEKLEYNRKKYRHFEINSKNQP